MSRSLLGYLKYLKDIGVVSDNVQTVIDNFTFLSSQLLDQLGQASDEAPASDTDNKAINSRLQRIAQNITTLIGAKAAGAAFDQPAGGSGALGYLSGVYKVLSGYTSSSPLPTQTPGSSTAEVRNGKLFTARVPMAAVAGKYPSAQLYNPAGSGKILTLVSGAVNSSTAAVQQCYKKDATLATEVLNVIANTKIGAGASVAKIYKDDLAALGTPTEFFGYLATATTQPGGSLLNSFVMIDIPEGHGVASEVLTANLTCAFTFYFTERDA